MLHDNIYGVYVDYGGQVLDNRAYNNSQAGIYVDYGGTGVVSGNTLYGNGVGVNVQAFPSYLQATAQLSNNLIYANTNQGVLLYRASNSTLVNNTIYQRVGDAVDVQSSSTNITLKNNILDVQGGSTQGYDINVDSTSEQGFTSDFNDLYFSGSGSLGLWEGHAFSGATARADWYYELGLDQHSLTSDPQLVNPAGPDGILGYSSAPDTTSLSQIIDNDSGSGFSTTGTSASHSGSGFNSDYLASTTAADTATYTFTVTPGWYQVGATWPATSNDYSNYTLFDGNAIGTVSVYQGTAPADYTASGASWKNLGTFYIAGTTLAVQLAREYPSNSVVADAVRIQRLQGDGGGDDNFHVESTSPTIDAGDPGSLYLAEPPSNGVNQGNGGRVNQGYDGNTPNAAQSVSPLVQMLAPNGLEKYVQGQTVTVQWRSNGLTNNLPVALINAGGPEAGTWSADAYRTDGYNTYTGTITPTVDISHVTNPAPQAVYQSYDQAYSGVGQQLSYQLPVPNGTYTLRLHFVEPSYSSAGQRKFNVLLQGATVQSNYDIYAAAGALDRATTLSFTVTASGGNGIALALVNVTSNPAVLSGIELSAANPGGMASPTANVQLSADNGATWTTLAANQPLDNYGSGSYLWTVPANQTPGNQYLMRVVANSGGQPVGVSAGNFLVAPSGANYYVNDGSQTGDQYTTAVGSNVNSGKTPDQPMSSLAALLAAYRGDFHAGDTIYVDNGTYNEVRNVVLTAADNAIRIQGPTAAGATAVINRGNTASGQYVFQLSGAQNVTLDHLSITGGYDGVEADSGVNSAYLTLSNSTIYGNYQYGVYLNSSNTNALVSGNTVYQCSTGIYVNGAGSGTANQNRAMYNIVHDNTYQGISLYYNALAQGNTVYRQTSGSGYGIYIYEGGTAQQNVVHDNIYGVYVDYGAQVLDNRAYDNSQAGIRVAYDNGGTGVVTGNTLYSNGVGVNVQANPSYLPATAQLTNNLIYANTNQGVLLYNASNSTLVNNTIYQPVGDAVDVQSSSTNITLKNNVLDVQGGSTQGYDINVDATSEQGFASDFNDLYFSGSLGLWEGHAFGGATARADWYYELGLDQHSLTSDPQFPLSTLNQVVAAGNDGILGFSSVPDTTLQQYTQIVDNDSGSGFSTTGTWASHSGSGFNNDYLTSTTAADTATYTFTVTPGWYQVGATWPATSGDYYSNYTLLDGNAIGTVQVNQSVAPSDYTASGASWKNLGTFYIAGTTLSVQLARGNSSYSVVADAVRIQRLQGDGGADDDFHVQSASPTIDAGDPGSLYASEPAPNGGRVNQGYDGNTVSAAQSVSPLVQMLAPNGLEKYVQGQTVTVQWRSNGLTNNLPAALINAGGPEAGTWSADAYRSDGYTYTGTITPTVNTSLVTNPAPQAVYQSYDQANSGVGQQLSYQLPVPDGTYTLRLHFVEPSYSSAGQRKFNVLLQGATVQSNYDIYAAAGALDRATTLSFTVTAGGGSGIALALVNVTSNPAVLSGIELSAANPSGTPSPTANVQLSADNGSTWTTLATNQPLDNYGSGSYLWAVPANETPGNQYLMRVVANSGGQPVGVSAGNFLVAPSGTSFYVNDGSQTGDQYTTAVGSNVNSGKTPDQPMASLAALLGAYGGDFHAGDTIYVDNGTYNEVRNVVLTTAENAIRIQGPTTAGSAAVINRGNTASGQYVFQLSGAQNVTLDHLSITGGYDGVEADSGVNSAYLTLSNSTIYGNYQYGYGVYLDSSNDHALISGNAVYGSSTGIYLAAAQDVADSNTVYQCSTGIYVNGYYVSGTANQSRVTNNTVHDTSSNGILLYFNALAQGNTVYRTTGSGYGIYVYQGGTVQQNTVHDNIYGVYVYNGGQVLNNRAYNNSQAGIYMQYGNMDVVTGNTLYNNGVGVEVYGGTGQLTNNLIYANTNQGVLLYSSSNSMLVNNTIYQPVGDAVHVQSSSTNITLKNNILDILAGYDLYVAADSQAGLVSNYNLFYRGAMPAPNAYLGYFNSTTFNTLPAWQSASGKDANSLYGDPLFRNPKGADNTLGYDPVHNYDGGPDDNFQLSRGSQAIDRGDAWAAPATDYFGNPRVDDPGSPNLGSRDYAESNLGSNSFQATGTAQNWRSSGTYWTLNLPFAFTFYGVSYTSVQVSSSGFLQFAGPDSAGDTANSAAKLLRNTRIAPLWMNMRTNGTGNDIFVDTTISGQVTIRWNATNATDNSTLNFSVTLFNTGNIRFDYGSGNTNLSPTIGISRGDGQFYVLSQYNAATTLTNANSVQDALTAGLTYADIGAYEFQGNSNDGTQPVVTAATPEAIQAGNTIPSSLAIGALVNQVQVSFSKAMDQIERRRGDAVRVAQGGHGRLWQPRRRGLRPGAAIFRCDATGDACHSGRQLAGGQLPTDRLRHDARCVGQSAERRRRRQSLGEQLRAVL